MTYVEKVVFGINSLKQVYRGSNLWHRPGFSNLNQPRAAHLSAGHKAGHMEQN